MLIRRSLALVPLLSAGRGEAQREVPSRLVEPPSVVLAALTPQVINAHMRLLADDLLEGRAPGTRGGDLAARYIVAQFEAAGLKPAGSSAYLQWVPLVGVRSEASLVVGSGRRTIVLTAGADFIVWPDGQDTQTVFDGELVFAGFGIVAPEESWNDFAGPGVTGKVVVVRLGEPDGAEAGAFRGTATTRYSRWTYKIEQARRAGAAGVLLIHGRDGGAGPWDAVVGTWRREVMVPERVGAQGLRFAGWITADAARRIVEATGKDYDVMMRRAEVPGFRAIELGARAALDMRASFRSVRAPNVVGVLDGSDTAAAAEAVYFVAHYDHLGTGPPLNGDSVYNGAVDNASGTAALLVLARAFASAERPPRRTMVFAATTAGESGLAGAARLAGAPPTPLERVAAVINLHEMNVWGRTEDVVGIGAELSTLGSVLGDAARLEGLLVTRPFGEAASEVYASDHFVFAQLGVPILALAPTGRLTAGPDRSGADSPARYRSDRWHRPSDTVGDGMSLSGLVQQLRVLGRVGWHVAQDPALPSWLPSAEFQFGSRRPPSR